ncbi:hypothetical protein [Succinimonas sp.]|uniref:hypothetical protein n=1 Tax=Succinimonas sp. TaxID=1936151 RepID=UPI00386FC309
MTEKMTITPEELADRLHDIISEKSPDYLSEHPLSVYDELKDKISPALARAVHCTILADIHRDAKTAAEAKAKKGAKQGTKKTAGKGAKNLSPKSLAADIRERCLFNEETADFLAAMYWELFSESRLREYQECPHKGFRELCSGEIPYGTAGELSWENEEGYEEGFSYGVDIVCVIQDPDRVMSLLGKALEDNPSATAEELRRIIEEKLNDTIGASLDDCYDNWDEDSINDLMDDFEVSCREKLEQLKENGIKLLKYECNVSEFEDEDEPDDGPVFDEDDWRSLVVWKKVE